MPHAVCPVYYSGMGNRGFKILWIGIESPRVRNDFIPGGALGSNEGTFVDFPC